MPDHLLFDGQITRVVRRDISGAWSVTTRGIGNNVTPGMATINEWQGPKIFNDLDERLKEFIERDKAAAGQKSLPHGFETLIGDFGRSNCSWSDVNGR